MTVKCNFEVLYDRKESCVFTQPSTIIAYVRDGEIRILWHYNYISYCSALYAWNMSLFWGWNVSKFLGKKQVKNGVYIMMAEKILWTMASRENVLISSPFITTCQKSHCSLACLLAVCDKVVQNCFHCNWVILQNENCGRMATKIGH